MGLKNKITSYYVRVDPGFHMNNQQAHKNCKDLIKMITRHVDDIGDIYIDSDIEKVCEFCGEPWVTGVDSPHNNGCCDRDSEIYEQYTKQIR